jgi:CBS domain containing-hemolysin-like protein
MLRDAFVANGLSRVIIFRNTIDNIVGYCHAFDLFKKPATIAEVVREISFIPETMPARDVLSNFIEKSLNIAVVVDEFGGTAGLVTMEDIMEEIFGEIEDEYDEEMMTEEKVGDNAYVFSSRLEIDYLNEKYNLSLPVSEEYETLAGLLIHYAEDIPDIREKIDIEDYSFVILSSSEKKIDKVKLTIHTN